MRHCHYHFYYDYTMRGQVREIATKGFTQKLWYEDRGSHPCYNGNISRMQVDVIAPEPACKWREKVLK